MPASQENRSDAPSNTVLTGSAQPLTSLEWRIEGRKGHGYIISAGVNAEWDGPADYVGVLAPMFSGAEPPHLADSARLVSAAPRLLKAAKMALAYGLFTGAEAHDAREALADAIAKAEGQ